MLPLLLLLLLHHGRRNERAEKQRGEKEREKKKEKWIKGKKERRGWGPNNFLTKPAALSPEICWQTMKEVSRIQRGWGPAKKPTGERESEKGGQVGGGREGEKETEKDGGLIHRSHLHCHQEFISCWKGVKEGWKGQRTEGEHSALHSQRPGRPPPCLSTCTSPPPPLLPVVFHPALSASPPLFYLLSLLASPSRFSHLLQISSSLHPSLQLSFLTSFHFLSVYYPWLIIHLQTLTLRSPNWAEQPLSRQVLNSY